MADEINTENLLQEAQNALKNALNGIGPLLSKISGEHGAKAAISYAQSLATTLRDQMSNMQGSIDFSKLLSFDEKQIQDVINQGFKNIESYISHSVLKDVAVQLGVNVDTAKIDTAMASITKGLANTEAIAQLGIYGLTSEISKGLSGLVEVSPFKKLEEEALKLDKLSFQDFGKRLNPANIVETSSSLDGLNKAYREQVQSLVTMGLSVEDSSAALRVLGSQSNISLDQIQRLGAGVFDTGKKIEGAAGFERILASTGMEAGTAAKLLELQMRSLGVQAERSLEIFDTLNKVQEGTRLNINEVGTNITNAATKFRFFGDNIDGVATIYKQLLKGLGEGKEVLAADIFDKVTTGISGMSTEMKAFIGLTTQLGGGGGGLESALRIEEALSSGEGLNEVMDSIYQRVQDISGTQLLTRQQALDTGQSQQYFVQRQLLGQFTGVRDDQAMEQLVRARQNGGDVTPDQLRPDRTFGERTAGTADQSLNQSIGPQTRLLNQLTGTAQVAGTDELSKTLLRIGQGINPAGEELVGAIRAISANLINQARGGNSLGQIMEGFTERREARLATEQTDKDLMGVGDKGLGQGEELSAQLGMGQLLGRGYNPLSSQVDTAATMEKTGQNPLVQLSGYVEIANRTGQQSLEKYANIIELESTGNEFLNQISNNTAKAIASMSSDKQRESLTTHDVSILPVPRAATENRLPTEQVSAIDKDLKAQQSAEQAGIKSVSKVGATTVPLNLVVTMRDNTLTVEPETRVIKVDAPHQ